MEMRSELNERQRQAAETAQGPVLVVAGPGTGKTKTLVAHVVYLIQQLQGSPDRLLVLAFTKKTAEEIQERLRGLIADAPRVLTFHALCYELLGTVRIATTVEQLQVIKELTRPAAYGSLSLREVALLISRFKNMAEGTDVLKRLVQTYDEAMRAQELLDFDDLLVRMVALLERDEPIRLRLQARFDHILVDEFQDTNQLQYRLLRLLNRTDNVFVIGDPNQSIYGFRGASGGIFDQFYTDFPTSTVVTLTTNYRSRPEIVVVGNAVFADAPQLRPYTQRKGLARVVQVYNEYSEADWVLGEIQRAIGGSDMLSGVSNDDASDHRTFKDFAILYRNRSVARVLQRRIVDSGLPYQVVGEGSPYEQAHVQTMIALLRSVLLGHVVPGLSDKQRTLVGWLAEKVSSDVPHVVAEKVAGELGLETDPGIQQFIGTLVRFPDLASAIAYFDALAESNFFDAAADAITLLTIHASKGLEFPYVFLVGTEDDILPYAKADIAEEKRLFYVAVTRAKEQLTMLYATRRGGSERTPSQFVGAIDSKLLPREIDGALARDQRLAGVRARKRSQQSLF